MIKLELLYYPIPSPCLPSHPIFISAPALFCPSSPLVIYSLSQVLYSEPVLFSCMFFHLEDPCPLWLIQSSQSWDLGLYVCFYVALYTHHSIKHNEPCPQCCDHSYPPPLFHRDMCPMFTDWLVSLALCNSDNESQCACCQAVLYVLSSRHVTGSCSILNDQLKSVIMMAQGAVTIRCTVRVLWFLDGHSHVDQATTKAVEERCVVFLGKRVIQYKPLRNVANVDVSWMHPWYEHSIGKKIAHQGWGGGGGLVSHFFPIHSKQLILN